MSNIEHDCHSITLNVGIDWADKENVYEIQAEGSKERIRGTVKQTPEDLAEWVMELKKKISGGSKIAVALEQSRGSLIYFLQQFDFIILYLINPKSLAKFREAFRPSLPKDDPDDSGCLLDMLVHHREKLHAWHPDTTETRKLSAFCELRRSSVDERTAIVNKMTSFLKYYYPQALSWAGDLTKPMACDFLDKWPTLQAVKQARPETLRKFYRAHHSTSAKTERRLVEIQKAAANTTDAAIIEPYSLALSNYVQLVVELNKMIATYDKEIERLFAQHPDHDLFAVLPGAGPVMAPRLLTAIGSDRNRYQSAVEIQQYSGIAPITRRSGKSKIVSRRFGRPKFICQSWIEFAQHSVGFSAWAKAYYSHQRSYMKKGRYAALRSLAYKWIRIIFRCWKLNEPYNEQRYLDSLRKHNSPLVALMKIA